MSSRHTEPLTRIIMAYPPGSPGLLIALETYIKTASDQHVARTQDDMAAAVCEGLCVRPRGLKCLACYESEKLVPEMLKVEAEREIAERIKRGE